MYIKYENMQNQVQMMTSQTEQLRKSTEAISSNSIWRELLEPLASRWGGAIKVFAYSVAAASSAVIVVGVGAWHELRAAREEARELKALREEIQLLRRVLEDACPEKLRELDRARLKRLVSQG